MFVIHRYVNSRAGKPYLAIESIWREASMMLCHKTHQVFIVLLNKNVDKLVHYTLLPTRKPPLKFTTDEKMASVKCPKRSPLPKNYQKRNKAVFL